MQAFLDESGTHPETPVLAVAGCYGEEEQWREFRLLWSPYSNGFHAKDCSSRFPELTEALKNSGIKAMLISVGKETYKRFASAHFQTALGNPYSCCALLCAAEICAYVGKKTAFVLEAGQPNLGAVKNLLEAMKNAEEWCVGSVHSAEKSEFIELQTADFVSHICSSYDKLWMGKLFELKILRHAHLTQKNLEETTPKATLLFRTAKAMRKAAKRGITSDESRKFNETMTAIFRADPKL